MNTVLDTLEYIEIPVWVFDISAAKIPWSNQAGLQFWGAQSVEDLAQRDLEADMSASVRRRLEQYTQDCHANAASYREYWTVYPKGVPQSAEVVFSPFMFADEHPGLLIQLLFDSVEVTSDSLRSNQALMHTSAMISLYASDYELIYCNPAARSVAAKIQTPFSEQFVHQSDLEYVETKLEKSGSCEIECEVHSANGVVSHAMSIQLSPDPSSGENSILVSATDVTERRYAQEQALVLAYTDSLTGLPNRIALLEKLENLIKKRRITQEQFALLFIDLDRFKLINDSLGHAVGDALLNIFAELLCSCINPADIVGRLGGDEFVVVIRKFDGREALIDTVQRILDACANPAIVAGHALRIAPSVGICLFPDDGTSVTKLLPHADLAMYAAKRSSEHYQFFEEGMGTASRDRLAMENDMDLAFKEGQFELLYQPKVGTVCGRIVGVEALIRWNHPKKGVISPMDFIPVAEETGLIVNIGQWVINQACADQVRWQKAGHAIPVAINISPKQFLSPDFTQKTQAQFAQSNVDPHMIDLEITESVLIGDKDLVLNIMDELHSFGVKFSIDDFGTGYSNLAYLQKYPLDSLKIDKAFLDDVNDTALLELILGIAKILNLKVVAEGVETAEQVSLLVAHACDEMQGYYFSKPIPLMNLLELLRSQHFVVDSLEKTAHG